MGVAAPPARCVPRLTAGAAPARLRFRIAVVPFGMSAPRLAAHPARLGPSSRRDKIDNKADNNSDNSAYGAPLSI